MMPPLGHMNLSIDVSRYFRLPPGVTVRFDGWWLEHSMDKNVISLSLGEAEMVVEQYVVDGNGGLVDGDGDFALELARYTVRTMPPREAFE